jgi:hypothetical protein
MKIHGTWPVHAGGFDVRAMVETSDRSNRTLRFWASRLTFVKLN